MNMIERIARALVRRNFPGGSDADIDAMWEGWADDAATAIQAMRDPTPEMIDRFVSRALCVSVSGEGGWSEYALAQWQTMIDAALIDASPIDTYEMEPIDTSFGVGEG